MRGILRIFGRITLPGTGSGRAAETARGLGIAVAALVWLLAPGAVVPARAQPSAFEAPADLFYLHPLVNYAHPVRWQVTWERERLARGGMQVTVGSISTKDFATLARIELVEPATDRLRFLYRFDWNESPHVDGGERQNWLGLELSVSRTRFGVFGAEMLVHPTSDKAELDLWPGIVWSDRARRNYLRLGWRRDDSVYGDKNDRDGVQLSDPSGPSWALHVRHGMFELSGEGTVLRPVERRFDDASRSPDLAFFREKRSWSSHAVRWVGDDRLVEFRFEHRDLQRIERVPPDAVVFEDRRQDSRWRHARLAWEQGFGRAWRGRASVHRLHYDNEFVAVDHRRRETMFGAFVERRFGDRHWVDVGWMSTDFSWTSSPDGSVYGRDQDGIASKLAIGWTLEVTDRGWLRALLSHEPDPQQFGGANLQAQMMF